MKVTVLMENVTPNDRLCAKHGLSLFLETTAGVKILFDMGPDGSFLDNAKALGVTVASADFAILSHGHFDHAGGLGAYLEASESAPVYVNRRAFVTHQAKTPFGLKDIGADAALANNSRIQLLEEEREIGDGLLLFAGVEPKRYFARSNAVLLEGEGDEAAPDTFAHEQSLIVIEGERAILVSGCSHTGIVNIIERAEKLAGRTMDVVVAGMHLMDPASGALEDPATVQAVAEFLASRPTKYYTFHCTGLAAYSSLRDTLGNRIEYLFAGSRAEV